MKRHFVILFILLCMLSLVQTSPADLIRQYLVGDIDEFIYEEDFDLVYVESDWLAWAEAINAGNPNEARAPFDLLTEEGRGYANKWFAFSFLYDISPQEQIIAATLTLAIRGADQVNETERVILEQPEQLFTFEDLNWMPVPWYETTVKSMQIPPELWPSLSDGVLNCYVADDVAIDYALFTLTVTPEPCTVLLLGFGGLLIRKR